MNLRDRMRGLGVSEERLGRIGLGRQPTTPEELRTHATRVASPTAASDVDVYRRWRDCQDPFQRAALRQAHGAAIERGREIDTFNPQPPPAA